MTSEPGSDAPRAAGSRGQAGPGLGQAGRRARWGRCRRARAPRGGSAGPGPALCCAASRRRLNSGACRAAVSFAPLRGKGRALGALRRTRFLYRGSLRLCCRGGAGGRQAERERAAPGRSRGGRERPGREGPPRAGGRDRAASSRGRRHSRVFTLTGVCENYPGCKCPVFALESPPLPTLLPLCGLSHP